MSVRNNEILRANNRDLSGFNGDFLCAKGRFGFDFTHHPERIRQPLVRRNGKLEPASWEEALEKPSPPLKQVRDKQRRGFAIGVIGSNRTTNEENYLLDRFARATLGTNNIDHHRTADYAGLAAALGPNADEQLATMADIYNADCCAADRQRSHPAKSAGRLADSHRIRHHQQRLFIVDEATGKARAPGAAIRAGAGRRISRRSMRWLATGDGDRRRAEADLAQLHEALGKESDVVIVFGAGVTGAAIRDLVAVRLAAPRQDALHGAWAITPIRAAPRTWACCRIACRAMRR